MRKYLTHRDESVQVKTREKSSAGKRNRIVSKNIALSVTYTKNLQCLRITRMQVNSGLGKAGQ